MAESNTKKCERFPTFKLTQGVLTEIDKINLPNTYSIFTINEIRYSSPGIDEVFSVFFRGILKEFKKELAWGVFGALPPTKHNRVVAGETFQTTHQDKPANEVWADGMEQEFIIQWTETADEARRFAENPEVYEMFMKKFFEEAVKLGWQSFWNWSLSKMLGTEKTDLEHDPLVQEFFDYYEPSPDNKRPYFSNVYGSVEGKYGLWKDGRNVGVGICCDDAGKICSSLKGATLKTITDDPWLNLLKKIATGINAHKVDTLPSKFVIHCIPEGEAIATTNFERLQKIVGFFEKISKDIAALKRQPRYWSQGGVYANSSGTESGRKPIVLMNTLGGGKKAFCFDRSKGECNNCVINDYNGKVYEVLPDVMDISKLVLIVDAELLDDYKLHSKFLPNININTDSVTAMTSISDVKIIPVGWLKKGSAVLIHKEAINIYFRLIKGWSETTKDSSFTTVETIHGGMYKQYRQNMGIFVACNPHKFVRRYQLAA